MDFSVAGTERTYLRSFLRSARRFLAAREISKVAFTTSSWFAGILGYSLTGFLGLWNPRGVLTSVCAGDSLDSQAKRPLHGDVHSLRAI